VSGGDKQGGTNSEWRGQRAGTTQACKQKCAAQAGVHEIVPTRDMQPAVSQRLPQETALAARGRLQRHITLLLGGNQLLQQAELIAMQHVRMHACGAGSSCGILP
jgi:hypothetical protein